jgi:hypothetical protein
MQQLQLDYAIPDRRRRRPRVERRVPAAADASGSLDTASSQNSAPALSLLPLGSAASTFESSSRPLQAHVFPAPRAAVARDGLRPRVRRDSQAFPSTRKLESEWCLSFLDPTDSVCAVGKLSKCCS